MTNPITNPNELIMTAVKFLQPVDLAREPDLSLKCWPAYTHLSPMQRTIEFAKRYSEAFREHFHKNIDRREALHVKGVDLMTIMFPRRASGDAAKGGHLTSMNRARQLADEVGLPYLPFIRFCLEFASNRGIVRVVAPHQLMPKHYEAKWQECLGAFKVDWLEVMVFEYRTQLNAGRSVKRGCAFIPGTHNAASPICSTCHQAEQCIQGTQIIKRKLHEREALSGQPETFEGYRKQVLAARQNKNSLARKASRARAKNARFAALEAAPRIDQSM